MAENSENSGGSSHDNNGRGIEYESDPEDAKLSLKARRREASDDEDENEKGNNQRPPRRVDVSDVESEGAVAEYDDALGEDEDYAEEGELEEEDYEEDEYDEDYFEEDGVGDEAEMSVEEDRNKLVAEGKDGNLRDGGEERKESAVEPFTVPKSGAFYMHDDRFGDNAGRRGRHRRTIGGRRLWESKDNRKWGHDKFEELTTPQRRREEHRRGSRGRYRGRGRAGGAEHHYAQGTKGSELANYVTREIQNDAPKIVRGRGPRRYQPSFKNKYGRPITLNKRTGESVDKASRASSVSSNKPVYNAAPSADPQRKQVASNLNIASPPFYPTGTGSSTKDNISLQKKDAQVGATNQNGQSTSTMRGKNVAVSVGMEKLSINDSNPTMTGRASNLQTRLSNSSSHNSARPQLRGQRRGTTSSSQMAYQPVASNNPVNKVPPASQRQNFQRSSGQNHAQSSRGSGQQVVQRMPGQSLSPPKAAGAVNEFESAVESASASGKYKTSLATKGRGAAQQSGKGSFMYGASQVMGGPGNITGAHGDQNFPTFLPIMQLGAQHPGGIGVPAVGMAFPGYVGQGRGNSEMTWLPVLAGAAGALGSRYCPPYLTVDGSYNARPSGQISSAMSNSTSSIDNNAAKVGGDMAPAQKPDLGTEDLGQRQKNTRRYTEMKFNQ